MHRGRVPASSGRDRGRPQSRRGRALSAAAAALVALIAGAAVVLIVWRPQTGTPRAAVPRPRPSATQSGPSAGASALPEVSVCGLQPGLQNVPVVAPAGTSWDLVGTMAAPSNPASIGPGRDAAGLRSCYAHSPLGALYAAAGFLAATSDPDLRLRAAEQLTASGQGRDRAVDLLTGADPGPRSAGLQIAGFSFLNYTPTESVVDVAMQVQSVAVHLPVTVAWQQGDWKVVLPDTGLPFEAIQPLPNLTGYVPWAGA